MKRIALASAILIAVASIPLMAQQTPPQSTLAQPRLSPHDAINLHVGARNGPLVTIYYGRPFTNDPTTKQPRVVWGTLVPWDKVWRLGSDEATTMITQKDLLFGDVTVPAGAYTLCMLPVKDGPSKLIINKQIGQWGIPYTADIQKNELARIDLKKEPDLEKSVDELTLSLANDAAAGGAVLKITWEKSQYSVAFKVKP